MIHQKQILWFDRRVTLACDGQCNKAWGINNRPKVDFDPDEPDDYAFLADHELGEAPSNPGVWEGGHGKPFGPDYMNKWCARECERSGIFEHGEEIDLSNYSARVYNMPSRHKDVT
ncbi:hypothetical protein SAMN05443245_5174 [Paraburkholderia fungorum]|uniref:Uncharacterized protein n=1 Tax=Paraburkholderia fungorum TaxID=134537 RepID=A0A1H1IH55_9BURK|nr:hypothetical protein [Paraburkholderia fungorum]SDR37012.1 hypothetical protein SAMN05443245_5174 [Paraburkholderia fungorum]